MRAIGINQRSLGNNDETLSDYIFSIRIATNPQKERFYVESRPTIQRIPISSFLRTVDMWSSTRSSEHARYHVCSAPLRSYLHTYVRSFVTPNYNYSWFHLNELLQSLNDFDTLHTTRLDLESVFEAGRYDCITIYEQSHKTFCSKHRIYYSSIVRFAHSWSVDTRLHMYLYMCICVCVRFPCRLPKIHRDSQVRSSQSPSSSAFLFRGTRDNFVRVTLESYDEESLSFHWFLRPFEETVERLPRNWQFYHASSGLF